MMVPKLEEEGVYLAVKEWTTGTDKKFNEKQWIALELHSKELMVVLLS